MIANRPICGPNRLLSRILSVVYGPTYPLVPYIAPVSHLPGVGAELDCS